MVNINLEGLKLRFILRDMQIVQFGYLKNCTLQEEIHLHMAPFGIPILPDVKARKSQAQSSL